MVKLSIITINLNNLSGLKKTISSVLRQTFEGYEYIIIDGKSNDGSQEFIQQNEKKLSCWISEKDDGVYAAMNKGIKRAMGEYLLFLNSGDSLAQPNSLQILIDESKEYDLVYGNLLIEENSKTWVKTYPEVLTFKFFLKDSLPHPSTLINLKLFRIAGLYNEKLRIVSDWEFFMNAICKLGARYRYVNEVVATFQYNGLSSVDNIKEIEKERDEVLISGYMAFLPDYQQAEKNENRLENLQNSRWMRVRRIIRRIGF